MSNEIKILKFYADWCGPCRSLNLIFDILKEKNKSLKIRNINVDEEPDLVQKYGVRAIPTVIFIKDEKVVSVKIGNLPINEYQDIINDLL